MVLRNRVQIRKIDTAEHMLSLLLHCRQLGEVFIRFLLNRLQLHDLVLGVIAGQCLEISLRGLVGLLNTVAEGLIAGVGVAFAAL